MRASLEQVLASRQPDTLSSLKYDVARPDGTFEERWWSPVNSAVLDDDGQVEFLIHNANDVTKKRRAEIALRKSEERQTFLLELSDALRPLSNAAEILATTTRLLGTHMGVDRVMYAEVDGEFGAETGTIHGQYVRPSNGGTRSAVPFPERFTFSPFGAHTMAARHRGETLVVANIDANPGFADPERTAWAGANVRAAVVAALAKGDRLVAEFGVHSTVPRDWNKAEVSLVEEVAERTWAAAQRAHAETRLRDSEARFRQFSDASSNILWIRDAETLEMMFASPAFDAIYGIAGPERGGNPSLRSWFRLVKPENRRTVLANLRRVRAGERVEHEFQIRRATDEALRWVHNTDFPLHDAAGVVRWIAGLGADITFVREAADRQGVLMAELQHRTRNLIAVVRSLSDRTLGNAASLEDFGKRFGLRLSALSRVQGLLSNLAVGEKVTFKELLCSELDAHGAGNGMSHKVTLDGPADVLLRSATVQIFALALHELATNAAKYGALQSPDGHLFVSWRVEPASGADPPRLHVEWRESGVTMPEAGAPARGGGYGRELIERALPYQLKAKTTYEMGLDGVRCTIAVPLAWRGE